MTSPLPGWPQLFLEAGLAPPAPVAGLGAFILDDPVNGLLDTGLLSSSVNWVDITGYAITIRVSRPTTRVQGPLNAYQPGTLSVVLDNSDGRFDPDNSASPYFPYLLPMTPVRLRAVLGGTEFFLFSGFADGWQPSQVTYEGGYAELNLSATDGFKVLAGAELATVGAVGGGELSGSRMTRILNSAAWYTDHRKVEAGKTAVQATTYGSDALSLLQVTADTEIGELYVDGAGNVAFRNRHAILTDTRSANVQAVFGDLPGTRHTSVSRVGAFLSEPGMAVADFNAANALWSTWTGHSVPVTRVYLGSVGTVPLSADINQMIAAGTKMIISLKPAYNPVSAADLTSMVTFLQALAAAGAVCDIALWGEPFYSGLTNTQYTAMYRYYGPALRAYYPLVCIFSGNDTQAANGFYPGDAYCDKIYVDAYAGSWLAGSTELADAASMADAARPPKPFGITEFQSSTDPVNGQTQAQMTSYVAYIQSFMQARAAAGKQNADVLMFNGAGGANWLGNNSNANCGFEGGIGGWGQSANCTIASSAAQAHSGTGSLAMTATGVSNMACRSTTAANYAQGMPVTAGQSVSGFAFFRAQTLARTTQYGVTFYNSAGTILTEPVGTGVADSSTGWVQAAGTFTAPANAAYAVAHPVVQTPGGTGEVHYVDDVALFIDQASNLANTIDFSWDFRLSLWTGLYAALDNTVTDLGTELAYAAVTRASDDTQLATDVQITRAGGTLQEAPDTAATAKFLFPRTYPRSDVLLTDDVSALGYAQWVLTLSKNAENRFSQITVDPNADTAGLFPQVLGRDIGDRITVWNRPAGVPVPVVKDCFVRGITHDVDCTTCEWATTWSLQDASRYAGFLILDDPFRGKLDSNMAAY